jgi:hypothetical protein
MITAFYADILPKRGWLGHERTTCENCFPWSEYFWTDPEGIVPWHLYLSISVTAGSPDPEGKTVGGFPVYDTIAVTLLYGRYPDLANLPVYPDAQQVDTKSAETFDNPVFARLGIKRPDYYKDEQVMHTTTKTYLTGESPGKVEAYYKSVLNEHGWAFIHTDPTLPLVKEPGDISSETGLYFQAGHPGTQPGAEVASSVGYYLLINAKQEQGGLIRVQLVAVER